MPGAFFQKWYLFQKNKFLIRPYLYYKPWTDQIIRIKWMHNAHLQSTYFAPISQS